MGSWGSQGDPGKKEQGSGAMPGLCCETLSQNKRAEDVFVGTAVAWHVVKVSGFHGRGNGDMVRFVCVKVPLVHWWPSERDKTGNSSRGELPLPKLRMM